MTLDEFIIFKVLRTMYPKKELVVRARALGILLDSNERQERNKLERERRLQYGNKRLS